MGEGILKETNGQKGRKFPAFSTLWGVSEMPVYVCFSLFLRRSNDLRFFHSYRLF